MVKENRIIQESAVAINLILFLFMIIKPPFASGLNCYCRNVTIPALCFNFTI